MNIDERLTPTMCEIIVRAVAERCQRDEANGATFLAADMRAIVDMFSLAWLRHMTTDGGLTASDVARFSELAMLLRRKP